MDITFQDISEARVVMLEQGMNPKKLVMSKEKWKKLLSASPETNTGLIRDALDKVNQGGYIGKFEGMDCFAE
ncbi:MAG TPA: hypothetical protein VIQ00_10040 [Chitinophagaceae bacterium]